MWPSNDRATCAAGVNQKAVEATFCGGVPIYAVFQESIRRFAISNPRNVAPLAKGDLEGHQITLAQVARNLEYYRINVGPRPLVNAPIPSVRHTFRTQPSADVYFCPEDGEKPSVCILDLIISIG
jgi:hypothetical protein